MAYTVDDTGTVVPYAVPAGHPLSAVVHRSEVLLASAEYASHDGHLDTDASVARLMVVEDGDRVFSVASWADGVDTLLPRADYVAFPSDGAQAFFVAWDNVAREVDLDPEPGITSDRFRLRTWPHPGVVERLRKLAVDP